MPVHDWTRVDAGTFHAFHTAWITHLSEALNGGLLPSGFYALPEQHAGSRIADVLTLHAPVEGTSRLPDEDGGVAVVDAPPKTQRRLTASGAGRALRRTLVIRHVSGHRVIALLEIVSPANKDRQAHVDEFVDKVEAALLHDVHVLVVDPLPPGRYDPRGIHGAIWERFDDEPYAIPAGQPLTMASYTAGVQPVAYVEHLAVGSELTEMPLFLNPDRYVNVPMETAYQAAFRGLPSFLRDRLNQSD
jgi:hypothetical protein